MGSWEETCAFSNHTIRCGELAYVFILVNQQQSARMCYCTDNWSPVFPPVLCTYADYGEYEPVDPPWYVQRVVDALRPYVHDMDLGENEYHDIAVKKEELDWGAIQNAVHESRLFVEYKKPHYHLDAEDLDRDEKGNILDTDENMEKRITYTQELQQVTLVAVKKSILDKLMLIDHRYFGWKWRDDTVSPKLIETAGIPESILNGITVVAEEAYSKGSYWRNVINKAETQEQIKKGFPKLDIASPADHIWYNMEFGVRFSMHFPKIEEDYKLKRPYTIEEWWISFAKSALTRGCGSEGAAFMAAEQYSGFALDQFIRPFHDDPEKVRLAATRILELSKLNLVMSSARKAWGPTCGAGSQNINWGFMKTISAIESSVLTEAIKEDRANRKRQAKEDAIWHKKYIAEQKAKKAAAKKVKKNG